MTVDTQDTWLEYLIKAWCPGETSYNIKTGKILGDPINQFVWDKLLAIHNEPFYTESGKKIIVFKSFIDMAGHRTDEVKKFVKKNSSKFIMLKGDSRESKTDDARPTSYLKKSTVDDFKIMWVSTHKAKDIIFARLALQPDEDGFIHHNKTFDAKWFTGLTSEKKVFKKNANGFYEQRYINIAKDKRNEPLDLEVYQLGAVRLLQQQIKGFDLSIKE